MKQLCVGEAGRRLRVQHRPFILIPFRTCSGCRGFAKLDYRYMNHGTTPSFGLACEWRGPLTLSAVRAWDVAQIQTCDCNARALLQLV